MSGSTGRFKASEGDWVCSKEDCENVNFAKREKCNKCGRAKGTSYIVKKSGHEIGSNFADKSKGLFSAEDWQCNKCGNINWARRTTCNVCNAPKVGPDETRSGYGGGFKENEEVVYNEKKEDSDGEYDIYGRKKKKFRGKIPSVKSTTSEAEETKYQEEEKPKQYLEEEDDDDDDDDDDEDGDLSKYNLSSSDDDDNSKPPPEPKILKRRTDTSQPADSGSKRDRSRSPVSRS